MTFQRLCKCGCGKYANVGCRFISGHNSRMRIITPEWRAKIIAANKNPSNETRAKIGAVHKNKVVSPESRKKMSDAHIGKTATSETRAKMRKARENIICTDETRAKISAVHKNKVVSPESRKKISASNKGRTLSSEHIEKIKTANTGRTRSFESCKKISEVLRKQSVAWKGLANYDTYAHRLTPVEDAIRDVHNPLTLQVRCYKCRQYFIPKLTSVLCRISVLEDRIPGESNLYCSETCKNSCSVFNKQWNHNPTPVYNERPLQSEWRRIVLDKYGWNEEKQAYECEVCGFESVDGTGLIAHHWKPVKSNPLESADIDVGVVVCSQCDKKVHKLDGCSANFLSKCL